MQEELMVKQKANETPLVITNMRIKSLDQEIDVLSQKLTKQKEQYKKSIQEKKFIIMPKIFEQSLNKYKNESL